MRTFIIIATLLTGIATSGFGQKIGYINSNELLAAMPASQQVQAELEKYAKELESQLTTMSTEYESKVSEYQSNQALWSDPVKESKVEEIGSLEKRINKFQQTAQKSLSEKEQELLQPVLDKAQKAIDAVADEKGYDYVFDTSNGMLLHYPDGDNLLPAVKTHLGIE